MSANTPPGKSPNIPRRLSTPPIFDTVVDCTDLNRTIFLLLMHVGFDPLQAGGLVHQLLNLKSRLSSFQGILKDKRLPSPPYLGLVSYGDLPELGWLQVDVVINFHATDEEIRRDFTRWLRHQKKLLNRHRWRRQNRDKLKLSRDLVVFILSADKEWSVEDIERQLSHMKLPQMATTPDTDAKAARKKIVFDVRSLIRTSRTWLDLHDRAKLAESSKLSADIPPVKMPS